ncbi:MAG: CPXCG motif-containing cysteine-rich protein [Gammaproteobacteria bacterium]
MSPRQDRGNRFEVVTEGGKARGSSLQDTIACRMRIVTYSCAFCGEDNDVLVDPSGGRRQTFTEDCAVCCRPNLVTLTFGDDGTVRLDAAQEYEA